MHRRSGLISRLLNLTFIYFLNPFFSIRPMSTIEKKPFSKAKETAIGFVTGGLAACGAVTFTNPWEVCSLVNLIYFFYQ